MRIGVPKEIKNHEYRVGMTPAAVREAVHHGHQVVVQTGAGAGIACDDAAYAAAGATVLASAAAVFEAADMIVKVKEPQPAECAMLRRGQILFTYLHLAPDPVQAEGLLKSGCTAIAYETITDERGGLPLLAPMSEVAGRMAIQVGAVALQKANGGRGVLLGGVPGVETGHVLVIGGGVVGTCAAQVAAGMGAQVVVLDVNIDRLRYLSEVMPRNVQVIYSDPQAIRERLDWADLIVGAVLVPGAKAPHLIKRADLKHIRPGSVIVDVAIDQGGCVETARPTTHAEPTYVVDGVVHYCVANMPGGVPRTSTYALNNATLPFVLALADKGWKQALRDDPHLLAGLNVCAGQVTCAEVAEALGYLAVAADSLL